MTLSSGNISGRNTDESVHSTSLNYFQKAIDLYKKLNPELPLSDQNHQLHFSLDKDLNEVKTSELKDYNFVKASLKE